ncbi:MAG: type II toxin-antitoxin system VapC family toxin [Actinomycetota bacterium]
MSNKYLLDTNILIYYFNHVPEVQSIFDEIEDGDAEAFYCPISWVELLCYPDLTDEQANEIREFLRLLNCVSLIESVLDSAAKISRDYRLKLGDGVIAACALVEGCVLVTRNVDDFRRVNGLSVLNPLN